LPAKDASIALCAAHRAASPLLRGLAVKRVGFKQLGRRDLSLDILHFISFVPFVP